MLRWRLLWAAFILAPLTLLLLADYFSGAPPGAWLLPLAFLVAGLATAECLDLMASRDLRPAAWSVYCGALLVVFASSAPVLWQAFPGRFPWANPLHQLGWAAVALSGGVLLAFLGEMRRYEKPGGSIVRVALAVLVMTYVGLLMSFLIALRCYQSNELGMAALVSMIIVVKLSDTGAYACGRLLGRRKMAPVLSPGKTVEGAIGGVIAACAASWAVFRYLAPLLLGSADFEPPRWGWLWYGLVLASAGMLGDLAVSMFKRDMGRKDSSRWLPGLGGVLDVLDSVLASAPAAYLCWLAGLVGPANS